MRIKSRSPSQYYVYSTGSVARLFSILSNNNNNSERNRWQTSGLNERERLTFFYWLRGSYRSRRNNGSSKNSLCSFLRSFFFSSSFIFAEKSNTNQTERQKSTAEQKKESFFLFFVSIPSVLSRYHTGSWFYSTAAVVVVTIDTLVYTRKKEFLPQTLIRFVSFSPAFLFLFFLLLLSLRTDLLYIFWVGRRLSELSVWSAPV